VDVIVLCSAVVAIELGAEGDPQPGTVGPLSSVFDAPIPSLSGPLIGEPDPLPTPLLP
jgi:hypothetical protein